MKKLEDLNKSYFGPRVSDGAGVFVAGFVFLMIAQSIVLVLCQKFAGVDPEKPPLWFNWVIAIVNQVALVGSVAAYGGISRKPLLQECRINKKLHWKQVLIIMAIVGACIMAFLPLAQGFVKLVELITKKPQSAPIDIGTQWWEILITTILLSVLPAIGEEILFRGSVARSLKRKNYVFGIIVSGALFSIFHGNAAQTVHQFLIGMVFAYVYFVTGSLLASCFAHFFNNALAIVLEVATANVKINISYGGTIAIWVAMSVVGFVALYFLLRWIMKVSKEINGIEQNNNKMSWAIDLKNAFTISGIKDNYRRLNKSLRDLFDDPCDGINVNGDIQTADEKVEIVMANTGESAMSAEQMSKNVSAEPVKNSDVHSTLKKQNNQGAYDMDKMLEEINKETIRKRNRFDVYALLAAFGITLAVWILNLLAQ